MRFPPRGHALRFVSHATALIAGAWLAACGDPVTNAPETASPAESAESAAAQGAQTGVCDRTWQVRDEIMYRADREDCAEVTAEDLAGIWSMNLAWYGFDRDGETAEICEDPAEPGLGPGSDGARLPSELVSGKPCRGFPVAPGRASAGTTGDTTRITELKEGDLAGLTNLRSLTFAGQGLRTLPDGIFDDLGELTSLSFSENRFRTLRDSVFAGLDSLVDLDLSFNLLVRLPAHVFAGLGALENLDLILNNLHTLPAGVFADLGELRTLDLTANNLRRLPDGVFDGLVNLNRLLLDHNKIAELPVGVFDGLGELTHLWMDQNSIAEIPEGVFAGLGSLNQLTMSGNLLAELPEGAFGGLDRLSTLLLDNNPLTGIAPGAFDGLGDLSGLELCCNRLDSLPAGVFAGLDDLTRLFLNRNRLTGLPAGVFDELGDLTRLVLSYNHLDSLPEGVFDELRDLEQLFLFDNRLTGLPAGVFDELDRLEYLTLSYNLLDTLPEGIFDRLRDLPRLYLAENRLTELPDDVFERLDGLRILSLGGNRLASLPAGVFGELDDLLGVDLSDNRLADLPAGLFAGLNDLEVAWLDRNPGAPFPFRLELRRTDSTDPRAPPPATVEVRVPMGAPFEVEARLASRGGELEDSVVSISVGDTASRSITVTADSSAAHSLAVDSIWDDLSWFDEDDYTGFEFVAGTPLVLANPAEVTVDVPAAYLTQGSQALDGMVPLVAGRQALLRVFATADVENDFGPRGRATFHVGDDTIHVDLAAPALIGRDVDESRLDGSFTGVVPAAAIRPGAEMVVELDRENAIPATEGSRLRVPETGRMALDVVALDTFDLVIVPVAFGSDATGRNDAVAALAEDMAGDDSRGVLDRTRAMLPIAEMKVAAREPYVTWSDTLEMGILELLDEITLLRHAEAGGTDAYYHGLFASPATHYPDYWSGIFGAAHVSRWTGLSMSHQRTGRYFWDLPNTVAHELGHNLSLLHAPCGTFTGIDPRYPYRYAGIGVWGFEFAADGDGGRLLDPERHHDLMSYCGPHGMSDFNFAMALDYRYGLSLSSMARGSVEDRETLLLWGSVRDGRLKLEPVFEWTGPVKVPESPGPYRLEGTSAGGARLFELSFAPDETGDGDRGFLFAIESEAHWPATLGTVTLTGPEGSVAVRASRTGAAAIVTDRATGRIVSIARDWEGVLEREGAFPPALGSRGDVIIRRSLALR